SALGSNSFIDSEEMRMVDKDKIMMADWDTLNPKEQEARTTLMSKTGEGFINTGDGPIAWKTELADDYAKANLIQNPNDKKAKIEELDTKWKSAIPGKTDKWGNVEVKEFNSGSTRDFEAVKKKIDDAEGKGIGNWFQRTFGNNNKLTDEEYAAKGGRFGSTKAGGLKNNMSFRIDKEEDLLSTKEQKTLASNKLKKIQKIKQEEGTSFKDHKAKLLKETMTTKQISKHNNDIVKLVKDLIPQGMKSPGQEQRKVNVKPSVYSKKADALIATEAKRISQNGKSITEQNSEILAFASNIKKGVETYRTDYNARRDARTASDKLNSTQAIAAAEFKAELAIKKAKLDLSDKELKRKEKADKSTKAKNDAWIKDKS
ncbi:MAG: hypothetical protein KAH01_07610, partial [Caldisericia bacterium]|nr:hypothetical protein [Caldisericia bacterium]